MNGKNLGFLIVGLTVVLTNMARAQVITINPNNLGSGQVINSPGVTLQTETFTQIGTEPSGAPIDTFTFGSVYSNDMGTGCGCTWIGTSLFAPTPAGGLPLPNNENWGSGAFWGAPADAVTLNTSADGAIYLRVNFDQPTNFVEALGYFNGGDPTTITAFDAAGNMVAQGFSQDVEVSSGTPFSGWGDAIATTTTTDISTVLIGGFNSYRAVNEITYSQIPSPAPEIGAASAGSGLALLLGGLLVLRGRR